MSIIEMCQFYSKKAKLKSHGEKLKKVYCEEKITKLDYKNSLKIAFTTKTVLKANENYELGKIY